MTEFMIFDFDGTLADTARGIIETEREMLRKMGLPMTSEEQIRSAIGLPLGASLQMGGNVPDDRLDEAVETYRDLFFDVAPKHISLFDGVKDTLRRLHDDGIVLAIATSRGARSLDLILTEHGVKQYFSDFTTASDAIRPKPAPDLVLTLLERQGKSADKTIVVGDTTFDLDMGNGAGCRTVGVTWGNHSREVLATSSPMRIIDRFEELIDISKL